MSSTTLQLEAPDALAPPHSREGSGWLAVLTHLDPKYGGLSSVVPQLCASVAQTSGTPVRLAAFCLPDEQTLPAGGAAESTSYWPTSRMEWIRSASVRARFRELVRDVDGVHIHGLWEQSTTVAARTARELGKPYVLSAHGMLEPWALRNKRWKKQVYAALFEHTNVNRAACLHALTQAEAEDYRRFGSKAPIAVIPNAVSVPERFDAGLFLDAYPALRGRRLVLFLGRIHFKKGLDILLESWAAIAKAYPEAYLVLAGPDSESTQANLEQRVRGLGLADRVLFTGMLGHAMKWSALAAAHCFVLPSYSEGLSTSVLEAMAAGVPVIVTDHCHIPEVQEAGAGWVIPAREAELTSALAESLSAPDSTTRAMGAHGRRLVEQTFSWPAVARKMSEVYRWLAGGPLPESVDMRLP